MYCYSLTADFCIQVFLSLPDSDTLSRLFHSQIYTSWKVSMPWEHRNLRLYFELSDKNTKLYDHHLRREIVNLTWTAPLSHEVRRLKTYMRVAVKEPKKTRTLIVSQVRNTKSDQKAYTKSAVAWHTCR